MVRKNCRLSFNLQNLWKNVHTQIAQIKTHNKQNRKTSSISKENWSATLATCDLQPLQLMICKLLNNSQSKATPILKSSRILTGISVTQTSKITRTTLRSKEALTACCTSSKMARPKRRWYCFYKRRAGNKGHKCKRIYPMTRKGWICGLTGNWELLMSYDHDWEQSSLHLYGDTHTPFKYLEKRMSRVWIRSTI
jgi:hypothetical protein